jgi:hypothetical protein
MAAISPSRPIRSTGPRPGAPTEAPARPARRAPRVGPGAPPGGRALAELARLALSHAGPAPDELARLGLLAVGAPAPDGPGPGRWM